MPAYEATLTTFYAFSRNTSGRGWLIWATFLADMLEMSRHEYLKYLWVNLAQNYYLDVEQDDEFIVLRLSLASKKHHSLRAWAQQYEILKNNHHTLYENATKLGFFGCSYIYFALCDSEIGTMRNCWVHMLPEHSATNIPVVDGWNCGNLWHLEQRIATSTVESIYSIVTTVQDESVVNDQLIYHSSFWKMEALRHRIMHQYGKELDAIASVSLIESIHECFSNAIKLAGNQWDKRQSDVQASNTLKALIDMHSLEQDRQCFAKLAVCRRREVVRPKAKVV